MGSQQLFASFLLDQSEGLEIALKGESVAEATPIIGQIQKLPTSQNFVEGLMHLRDGIVPLINLKKRLGLNSWGYEPTAMVAIVKVFHRRVGLLFDDIREVFAVDPSDIMKIDNVLMREDKVISSLVTREKGKRTLELLDLHRLFPGDTGELDRVGESCVAEKGDAKTVKYARYVVFSFAGQQYGIAVDSIQEITFFEAVERMYRGGVEETEVPYSASIKDLYKHGDIDGHLTLRGRMVPVLNARRLLSGPGLDEDEYLGENTRVIVVSDQTFSVGLIVEEVKSIDTIDEDRILPLETGGNANILGIFNKPDGSNIMLLNIDALIAHRSEELQTLARLSKRSEAVRHKDKGAVASAHHLITENCYLVFWIGRNMAVQLKDVQEIIEKPVILSLPGANSYKSGVINLRGLVVPVVDLRQFYGYTTNKHHAEEQKLIICRNELATVALEVDTIVTIYKQEQYQSASSHKKDLAKRKDTLDRLIVFEQDEKSSEHVLVVNIHNLIRNHLMAENL